MRDHGTQTLRMAYDQGCALGAFSTYTQEITQAICRAAQDAGRPVILQAGASAFGHAGRAELAAQAVLAADLAGVPVGVHLDHSRDLAEIFACLDAGYTSVMVDGSHLPSRSPGPRSQQPAPTAPGSRASSGRSRVTRTGRCTRRPAI